MTPFDGSTANPKRGVTPDSTAAHVWCIIISWINGDSYACTIERICNLDFNQRIYEKKDLDQASNSV